jgi:hypothetical protein
VSGTFYFRLTYAHHREALRAPVALLSRRRDASRYTGVNDDEAIDWSDPKRQFRAVREYLAGLDPRPDPDRNAPKVISLSGPCSEAATFDRAFMLYAARSSGRAKSAPAPTP